MGRYTLRTRLALAVLCDAPLQEERSTFPHTSCPVSPLVFHQGVVCSMSLSTLFLCALSHIMFLLLFPIMNPYYFAMGLLKD
jgi:hypothetical protein